MLLNLVPNVCSKHTKRYYGGGHSNKKQRFTPVFIGKLTKKWKHHHLEDSNNLQTEINLLKKNKKKQNECFFSFLTSKRVAKKLHKICNLIVFILL